MNDGKNMLVRTLPELFSEKLRQALERHGWEFQPMAYARFKAVKEGTNAVLYNSGKLVVQGKGTQDFLEFILEPEVLGEAAFNGSMTPAGQVPFTSPHAGMDESGKGDFFGPLVTAAVYVMPEQVPLLTDAGVRDCKEIKSDDRLLQIDEAARKIVQGRFGMVIIGPAAYNRMYGQFRSLNPLLAWAHGKALENLLERVPDCTEAVADQFGDEHLILNALGERGRKVRLDQHHKAESDMAVATASVFARAAFLRKLAALSGEAGLKLPKGASESVDEAAKVIADRGGSEELARYGKMHFRTSYKALGLPVPEKTFFVHR